MPNETNPLFQSLTAALDYCRDTPVLQACVDMLADLVAHHGYTGHPDDECNWESAMRGDLEAYYYTCTDIQEVYEEVTTMLMEIGESHPSFEPISQHYSHLVDKYGADSKK